MLEVHWTNTTLLKKMKGKCDCIFNDTTYRVHLDKMPIIKCFNFIKRVILNMILKLDAVKNLISENVSLSEEVIDDQILFFELEGTGKPGARSIFAFQGY